MENKKNHISYYSVLGKKEEAFKGSNDPFGHPWQCLRTCMPEATNSFIIDKIASPLMSMILDFMSGIMGPVIFISMATSIIALNNIDELTNLGFKIIRRFVRSSLLDSDVYCNAKSKDDSQLQCSLYGGILYTGGN